MNPEHRTGVLWALPMALLLGGLCAATHMERANGWPLAFALYLTGFLTYGALLWANARQKIQIGLATVLLGALVFRLLLLPSDPLFSDDIWRYIWDGHVQSQGINPYSHAPNAEALSSLRNEIWPLINHPEVPTIYPPVAQIIFWAADLLGGGTIPVRLWMIASEALGLLAVWRLTRPRHQKETPQERQKRRTDVALWLTWNPLLIVEFAGSGHLDTLAITPLLWSLAVVAPRLQNNTLAAPLHALPWFLSGIFVGLSTNAKLLGLLALPALLLWAWRPAGLQKKKHRGSLQRTSVLLAGLFLALSITSAPYMTNAVFGESGTFLKGLTTYARKWRANDGAFAALVHAEEQILLQAPGASPDNDKPHWRFDELADTFRALDITHKHEGKLVASTTTTRSEMTLSLSKFLVTAALGFLLSFLLLQRFEPLTTVTITLAALLLLAPTVHPWYVAWLVPLAVASRSRSLLLWSGLVVLAYAAALRYALDNVWEESVWIRALEYIPVWIALLMEARKRITLAHPDLWRSDFDGS